MEFIRVDGYEKVCGKAKYAADLYFDRMVYAKIKRSEHAHAKIKSIKFDKALKLEGVLDVVTAKDTPGDKKMGVVKMDQFPLADDKVLYYGDAVAVVAAVKESIAEQALELIEVEYEELTPVFSMEEALKKEAPVLKEGFKDNIVTHYPLIKGDVENCWDSCFKVIEREYETQFHEHAYIEPECVIAMPDEAKDSYVIYGSFQNPYSTRRSVARIMGTNLNKVKIIQANLGGSFGGKDDSMSVLACRAAVMAKKIDRPVKITYTREESMIDTYKRHPYKMKYKVGLTEEGKLKAMKIEIFADAGAYISMTPFVTWRSVVQATGPYEVENVRTDIYGVATNNPYTGAFRGFGSPQIVFAQESLMDELAEIMGMDGLEFRRINSFKQGSITASGQHLVDHKVSLEQVVNTVIESSDYLSRKEEFKKYNSNSERFKKGIGFACSYRGCSLGAEGTDATGAMVSVQQDGSIYVLAGLAENGQGLKTTFCKIAGDVFGVNLDKFNYISQDTSVMADGGPTVASRSTLMGGSAVKNAAEIIRDRISETVKEKLKADKIENIVYENGKVINREKNIEITFEEAVSAAYFAGINMSSYGWFKAPDVHWDEEKGQGPAYFTYVYGSQLAEITVDTFTGKISVDCVHAAHDLGNAINYQGSLGQIYGGVVQGIGYSIFEEVDVQDGKIKNTNLDEYFIPTVKDIGEIKPYIIENNDKYGPWGAKSLGEPTLELLSAAINNAVSFATGKRYYKLPLDLETIVVGKQLKRTSKRGSEA